MCNLREFPKKQQSHGGIIASWVHKPYSAAVAATAAMAAVPCWVQQQQHRTGAANCSNAVMAATATAACNCITSSWVYSTTSRPPLWHVSDDTLLIELHAGVSDKVFWRYAHRTLCQCGTCCWRRFVTILDI